MLITFSGGIGWICADCCAPVRQVAEPTAPAQLVTVYVYAPAL